VAWLGFRSTHEAVNDDQVQFLLEIITTKSGDNAPSKFLDPWWYYLPARKWISPETLPDKKWLVLPAWARDRIADLGPGLVPRPKAKGR